MPINTSTEFYHYLDYTLGSGGNMTIVPPSQRSNLKDSTIVNSQVLGQTKRKSTNGQGQERERQGLQKSGNEDLFFGDFCLVCGNPTQNNQLYCSLNCETIDATATPEPPSLPPLTSSRSSSPPSSNNSSPLIFNPNDPNGTNDIIESDQLELPPSLSQTPSMLASTLGKTYDYMYKLKPDVTTNPDSTDPTPVTVTTPDLTFRRPSRPSVSLPHSLLTSPRLKPFTSPRLRPNISHIPHYAPSYPPPPSHVPSSSIATGTSHIHAQAQPYTVRNVNGSLALLKNSLPSGPLMNRRASAPLTTQRPKNLYHHSNRESPLFKSVQTSNGNGNGNGEKDFDSSSSDSGSGEELISTKSPKNSSAFAKVLFNRSHSNLSPTLPNVNLPLAALEDPNWSTEGDEVDDDPIASRWRSLSLSSKSVQTSPNGQGPTRENPGTRPQHFLFGRNLPRARPSPPDEVEAKTLVNSIQEYALPSPVTLPPHRSVSASTEVQEDEDGRRGRETKRNSTGQAGNVLRSKSPKSKSVSRNRRLDKGSNVNGRGFTSTNSNPSER